MDIHGKKAAIVTLGCKVNQYETDAMRSMLENEGVIITDAGDEPDIYIVNTCSVTNMAERKSRQMLHRAKRKNPNVIVVAVGCYAQVGKEELAADGHIDLIIGNNKKKDLIKILEDYEPEGVPEAEVLDIASDRSFENLCVDHLETHTRAYIKVQDGCNQFCSYCIIPYARGRVRSRQKEDVLKEIRNLAEKGCREFVITGIHVTSYGTDLGDIRLIDLLEEISGELSAKLSKTSLDHSYGFRFTMDNHTWTKGDNVSYIVSKIGGLALLSLVADGITGAMRQKEMEKKTPDILGSVQKQYGNLRASVDQTIDSVYGRLGENAKKQLAEYYGEKIRSAQEQVEQSAMVARQDEEHKEEIREAISEIRKILDEIQEELEGMS